MKDGDIRVNQVKQLGSPLRKKHFSAPLIEKRQDRTGQLSHAQQKGKQSLETSILKASGVRLRQNIRRLQKKLGQARNIGRLIELLIFESTENPILVQLSSTSMGQKLM